MVDIEGFRGSQNRLVEDGGQLSGIRAERDQGAVSVM